MIKFFEKFPELVAAMSEKEDGSMKIVDDAVIEKQNQKNRAAFFQKAGVEGRAVIMADLAHGNKVEIIKGVERRIISGTDGLVSKEKNILLAVTVADCVPIFFYEKEKAIFAIVHAGWRGVVTDILENATRKIFELGGDVENLQVAFGPSINVCHFEIKDDVTSEFANYAEFISRKDGKMFVDLKGIIKKQLLILGIQKENIEDDSTCTYCSENLFSFRRDKPKVTQAMIAVIGIK